MVAVASSSWSFLHARHLPSAPPGPSALSPVSAKQEAAPPHAAGNPGSLILPDGRDLGLTADNVLQTSRNIPQLSGQLAADGTGATTPLNVPQALAGAFDVVVGLTDLSEARAVVVQ